MSVPNNPRPTPPPNRDPAPRGVLSALRPRTPGARANPPSDPRRAAEGEPPVDPALEPPPNFPAPTFSDSEYDAAARAADAPAPVPIVSSASMAGDLTAFVRQMPQHNASDLLFVAGWPPILMVRGRWTPCDAPALSGDEIGRWLNIVLSPGQMNTFVERKDVDFALRLPEVGRFRVNAHVQNQSPAVAVRAVPTRIPRFSELGLPDELRRLVGFPHGLVLVTGGAGQGKSTTLASLIDMLNHARSCHVVTLEDPIEFEFPRGKAIIEQREIGADSPTFADALRHILRQRPDVIFVGEMRDLETIATAVTAAETGHLVLASLHACNTVQALSRIIDVFPGDQQIHVRAQLAASLRAVACQTLLPTNDGRSVTPATELLFATDGVRRAIRENETHLIYGLIETGRFSGMRTLEQTLAEMALMHRISIETARSAATHPDRFDRLLSAWQQA